MPYGFYTTNVGRKIITESINTFSKVKITNVCFGSGGDSSTERDYDISELKNQLYDKTFDTNTDSYKIDPNDPTQICITVMVPNEVAGNINEIGFKDNNDNLIFYGIVRTVKKEAGTSGESYQVKFENWIKIENFDTDKIEIKTQSQEYEEVQRQLNSLSGTVTTLSETVEGIKTTVESTSSELDELSGTVNTLSDSFNNTSNTVSELSGSVSGLSDSIDNIESSVSDIQSNITDFESRIQKLETMLNGLDEVLESLI